MRDPASENDLKPFKPMLHEIEVIQKVLLSKALQDLIGAGEWDLTEEEEEILWQAIKAAQHE
ncbi:MAG: hypothetical protein M9945_14400 [Aquamicrobium sp.]|uniref:hypothetical protein n=1 Tax=Aquamicrobium sp. TaxID=1872579 RepID=UPI00349F0323|nr:hypothetical protein [Aquamicrobium sp.]